MTYTPDQINQIARENRDRELCAMQISYAGEVARLAAVLHKALEASGGRYNSRAEWAEFNLCNALIKLIDDGDAMSRRETLMDELGCDEYGNPVDEYGRPPESYEPGSVHPDNPCKPKGYWA